MKLIGEYQNGNFNTRIYDDGTKIRQTDDNEFIPEFPECMDVKITNYCNIGCAWCHEDSTVHGQHGDILQQNLLDSIHPYTEIAIGGGNPLSHPDLVEFLQMLKDRNVIANMTVNQVHFMESIELLKSLCDQKLIHGLGVSFVSFSDDFLNNLKLFPNAVLHVINGVIKLKELEKLYNHKLKLLILGYKMFRRGMNFYSARVEENSTEIKNNILTIIENFQTTSFDNLAIDQLHIKEIMSKKDWQTFYMGDDGEFTFYIDLVSQSFSKSSFSKIAYPLYSSVVDMFEKIKSVDKNKFFLW